MIAVKTMLSEKTLADPRSGQARRELATFADSERVVQLCNLASDGPGPVRGGATSIPTGWSPTQDRR